MQAILRKINKIPGVRGTLILGADGLVVASDIAGGEDPGALGAVASRVLSCLGTALERMRQGALQRFVLNGTGGSLVLQSMGQVMLLTLLAKDANMGMVLAELKASAQELAGEL